MCGVCGVLALHGEAHAPSPRPPSHAEIMAAVWRMNHALAHRGPDDDTVHDAGWAVLGHRRLSIIDLDGGRQPIGNEDGSVQVLCNGEIYNYRELTALLKGRGHRFRTRSDTEAIVHAYEEWGAEALSRLRGMFAIAIYDRREERLLLARDPVGEKPLYYHLGARRLSFASEAKALLHLPWVERAPDPAGLADYLRYRYVAAPRTAFRDIRKLPAGTFLQLTAGHHGPAPEPVPYWHLSYRPKLHAGRRLLTDIVEEFIDESVQSRLCADVPLGVLLSGGLDSTLVAALMRRHLGAQPVPSFCAGFDEPRLDERSTAAQVARGLRTDHHECLVSHDAVGLLPRMLWHLDEPLGDPSIMPTFVVAELASRHVKAVLTGDGGDEAFAGYDRYRRSRLSDLLRALPRRPRGLLRRALELVSRRLPLRPGPVLSGLLARIERSRAAAEVPLGQLFERSMTAFGPEEVAALLHPDVRALARPVLDEGRVAALFDSADAEHYLDRFLFADLRSYLADDLMVKTDRMTMAHGLEARAPLLDTSLLAMSAALPVPFKRTPGSAGKQVLRDILRRTVPRSLHQVVADPRKRGFTPPLSRWLSSLGPQVSSLLSRPTLVEAGVLDRRAFSDFSRGGGDRRFLLLLLELWHRVVILDQRDARWAVAA